MKLRNKKTGEILGSLVSFIIQNPNHINCESITKYNSLAELNEEWEDYEESAYYYFIQDDGRIGCDAVDPYNHKSKVEDRKEIGNYFETKEEAERTVEKLKAWKRLKDKGAEFYGWRRNQTGTYELYLRWEDRIPRSYEVKNDLDLLFGGEE